MNNCMTIQDYREVARNILIQPIELLNANKRESWINFKPGTLISCLRGHCFAQYWFLGIENDDIFLLFNDSINFDIIPSSGFNVFSVKVQDLEKLHGKVHVLFSIGEDI